MRHSIAMIGLVLVMMLSACEGGGDLFDSYPPAQTPILATPFRNARLCPPSNILYVGTGGFTVDVRMQLFESLSIFENGKEIAKVSTANPLDNTTTVWSSEGQQTNSEGNWRIDRIGIHAPQSGWSVGQTSIYTFTVRSPNPHYTGTPQEYARVPVSTVVVSSIRYYTCPDIIINTGASPSAPVCEVAFFAAPSAVRKGEVASIEWRILNCSKAQLLVNGIVDRELKPDANQTAISGSAAIKIERPTTFELRSVDAGGGTRSLASKQVGIAPCPGGVEQKEFVFCISCLSGGSKQTRFQMACTEQEAKDELETQFGGCTITAGVCEP